MAAKSGEACQKSQLLLVGWPSSKATTLDAALSRPAGSSAASTEFLSRIRASESDANSARALGQAHLAFRACVPRGLDRAQRKGDGLQQPAI